MTDVILLAIRALDVVDGLATEDRGECGLNDFDRSHELIPVFPIRLITGAEQNWRVGHLGSLIDDRFQGEVERLT
eukprot:scaffold27_cov57-Cyclotella_meneghiniana.AAC.4